MRVRATPLAENPHRRDEGVDPGSSRDHVGKVWNQRAVRAEARVRYGLLSRLAALSLGLSDHIISVALARGAWDEVYPGVYYLNASPREWESDLMAAILAAGPRAVASHRSAARLWGLDGFKSATLELTVPFTNEPMPEGVLIHRTRRPPGQTLRESMPVTTVERTLLDLAAMLSERVLERTVQSALHARLTTSEMLWQVLATDGGRGVTGTRRFRGVLGRVADELSQSLAESEFVKLLRVAPIPAPEPQFPLRLPGGDMAYLDFGWPEQRKAIEIDGFMAHSTPDQLERDLRRQNQILELGWELRRFAARDIRLRPREIVGEVIRFLTP